MSGVSLYYSNILRGFMDILETVLPSDRAENFLKTSRTFSFKPHYEIVNNLSSLEQKIQDA